jgi:uncharacterized protein (TIGR02996 family)
VLSQQRALLQAILEDPDDDDVRRVFADWCEDNGQADRAEFIRLQLERDPGPAPSKAPGTEPSAREKALLDRYADEWFAAPVGWKPGHHYEVRRGFPWAVNCGYEQSHEQQETLDRWPITRLRPDLYHCEPEHARRLVALRLLSRIRELDLYYMHVGPAVLRILATSPSLADLRWLNVGSCALTDEGATILADHPYLPRLRHLDLNHNQITSAGFRALIESEHRGAIESLSLSNNHVTVEQARAFLESGRWTNLTDLCLWSSDLGDSGVARLVACPALARLTALNLNHNGISDDGVRILALSPHVHNLRTLSLSANELTSACADVLINSPYLRGLKQLHLTRNARIHWRKRRKLEEHFGDGVTFEVL